VLKPLASWNSNLRVWITEQESLFSEHSELFQEVFPKSGMTAAGRLFELQTRERLTSESESLLSPTLPTPTVFHLTMNDEPIETFLERESRSSTGQIGKSLGVALRIELFRTPTTTNATAGAVSEKVALERGATVKTQDQVAQLAFFNGLKVPDSITEQLSSMTTAKVSSATGETNWGKFTAAIERWEQVIGRKAPAPTKADGKEESHRLSSLFTEWLMGLPEGWITAVGLRRKDELKMAGNGVVPQQAELALRFLIDENNFK